MSCQNYRSVPREGSCRRINCQHGAIPFLIDPLGSLLPQLNVVGKASDRNPSSVASAQRAGVKFLSLLFHVTPKARLKRVIRALVDRGVRVWELVSPSFPGVNQTMSSAVMFPIRTPASRFIKSGLSVSAARSLSLRWY